MTYKDMEQIFCSYCSHRFFSSGAYKDHMRLEHEGRPLQKIIPWKNNKL